MTTYKINIKIKNPRVWAPCQENARREDKAPGVLSLGTRWRWVVRFNPHPLYPRTNTSGNHWLARVPTEPQNQSDVASNFCYSANMVRVRWSQRWCCRFESWSMLSRLDRKLPTFLRHYDPSKLWQTTEQSIWSAISEYLTILWSGQSRQRTICEHVEGVINSHKILVGKMESLEDTGANG